MAAGTWLPVRTAAKATGLVNTAISEACCRESQAAISKLFNHLDFFAEAQLGDALAHFWITH